MNQEIFKTLPLGSTKDGTITISYMEKPYGENSAPVASIGISLSGKGEPDWKTHIPMDKVDVVCEALKELKASRSQ